MNGHAHQHAFRGLNAREREGLVLCDRRGMLKASLAGLAGLSLPELLRQRAVASGKVPGGKSVILLWMAGGPSHIDTWDVKPDRPEINRGPFAAIATRLPGVRICEHLPRQAAMLDKFTIIRSVDARHSNHEPNKVFQTANLEAEGRTNPKAELYPAIGSVVARYHGANAPGMPPYIAFMRSRSHLAFAGYLGKRYDPFLANQATRLPIYSLIGEDTGQMTTAAAFSFPAGVDPQRIDERRNLLRDFDNLRSDLDTSGVMDAMDQYGQQAFELLLGQRARHAFDISREPDRVRDRYGKHLWCQQALLARRLVEGELRLSRWT